MSPQTYINAFVRERERNYQGNWIYPVEDKDEELRVA